MYEKPLGGNTTEQKALESKDFKKKKTENTNHKTVKYWIWGWSKAQQHSAYPARARF